jgi:hypothetical protein
MMEAMQEETGVEKNGCTIILGLLKLMNTKSLPLFRGRKSRRGI